MKRLIMSTAMLAFVAASLLLASQSAVGLGPLSSPTYAQTAPESWPVITCYSVDSEDGASLDEGLTLSTPSFGADVVNVEGLSLLCLSSLLYEGDEPDAPEAADTRVFACYDISGGNDQRESYDFATDLFGADAVTVREGSLICEEVSLTTNDDVTVGEATGALWLCYSVRGGDDPDWDVDLVNLLGSDDVDVDSAERLCEATGDYEPTAAPASAAAAATTPTATSTSVPTSTPTRVPSTSTPVTAAAASSTTPAPTSTPVTAGAAASVTASPTVTRTPTPTSTPLATSTVGPTANLAASTTGTAAATASDLPAQYACYDLDSASDLDAVVTVSTATLGEIEVVLGDATSICVPSGEPAAGALSEEDEEEDDDPPTILRTNRGIAGEVDVIEAGDVEDGEMTDEEMDEQIERIVESLRNSNTDEVIDRIARMLGGS